MEILKALAENPGSGSMAFIGIVMLIFYCGASWMKMKEMVTKQDLTIALLELEKRLEERYVTKEDCDLRERKKVIVNGGTV